MSTGMGEGFEVYNIMLMIFFLFFLSLYSFLFVRVSAGKGGDE